MKLKNYTEIAVILFVLLIGVGITGSVLLKQENESNAVTESVVVEEVNLAPQFNNIAPNSVIVGSEYSFVINYTDPDNTHDELELILTEAPGWIKLIDNSHLLGIPFEDDIGTHKVSMDLTDGDNTVSSEFYIIVEEFVEEEVSNE
jgi:hypothetical protein